MPFTVLFRFRRSILWTLDNTWRSVLTPKVHGLYLLEDSPDISFPVLNNKLAGKCLIQSEMLEILGANGGKDY